MEQKLEILEQLLLSDEGLIVSLRMGDGLNMALVQEICLVLDELKGIWKDSTVIPKKAVDLFVDFYPAMQSCESLYSEQDGMQIMDATDLIMDHIRDCYLS